MAENSYGKPSKGTMHEEADRARVYLDLAGVIFVAINTDGDVTLINKKGCEILGYEEHEIIGKNWFDNFVPNGVKTDIKLVSDSLISGDANSAEYHENSIITKSGEEKIIAWHNTVVRDDSGQIVGHLSAGEDITDRRQVHEQIRQAAEEWRTTFDSITEMVSVHDLDYKIVRANKAFADSFNMEPKQVIGKTCYELVHNANEPATYCPHVVAIRTKKPTTMDTFEPHLGIHIEVTAAPVFDDKGNVIASIHVARDITKRKLAQKKLRDYSENLEKMVQQKTQELENASEKLLTSERLALVGEITSGIAHDLRNPLNVISNAAGLIELLSKDNEADPKMDKSVLLMKAAVEQAINVIDHLMGSIKKINLRLEKVNISEYLYSITSNLHIPKNVQLIIENKAAITKLPPIMADVKQLERVFQNLTKNAVEAMPNGGTITIRPSINDSYLQTEIRDTGIGIPQENMQKVFNPLFTSKSKSGGTGIGLSVCKSIIEAHGGTIVVESEVGKGTQFTIRLPLLTS